jgi:hypothetical protein
MVITGKEETVIYYALPCGMRFRSSANFVGIVVGLLDVSVIRLRNLLLAAALSFECNMILYKKSKSLRSFSRKRRLKL